MKQKGKCIKCKKKADYICQSGRCVPCERKEIGKDGLEMLAVLLDMTNEGKKSVKQDSAVKEFTVRKEIKKSRFSK